MPSSTNPLRRTYDWMLSLAKRKSATTWLALLSFAEASFFPIPPDVLLIPLCLGALKRALKFALVCSVASVMGGIAGYAIGAFGWESCKPLSSNTYPVSPRKNSNASPNGTLSGVGLVFLAGFSPIPYKIFTIASGVLSMPLFPFILASAVSRSAGGFFLVAILLAKFGEPMKDKIDRHFNLLALLFGILLIGGFLAIKLLSGH